MLTVAVLGAGLTVYLLVLAVIGYVCGEAPGGLSQVLSRLRGDLPVRRRARWRLSEGPLSSQQRIVLTMAAAVVLALGGLLFFRSTFMAVLLGCMAPLYPYTLERTLRRKRQEALTAQFGVALQAMASSLRAGASLRTAVERSAEDLDRLLASQPVRPMVAELRRVEADLQKGFSLEEALIRFRDRVQLEDVTDFVGAVLLCRVRGGNVAVVMASIAEIIQDKITIRQQILTLTAGKRSEANMITFGPPAMVLVLGFLAPDYLSPLYHQLAGQVMLGVGTVLLAAAFLIGRKVLEIEL